MDRWCADPQGAAGSRTSAGPVFIPSQEVSAWQPSQSTYFGPPEIKEEVRPRSALL